MKKRVWILSAIAIILILLIVLFLFRNGKDSGGDSSADYPYTYQVRSSGIRFSVSRGQAEGYAWTCETYPAGICSVEKETVKKNDVFQISAEGLSRVEAQFTLRSDNNPYDCLYRICLAFETDEKGRCEVLADGFESVSPAQSGGQAEGLPYTVSENTDGSVTVLISSTDAVADRWETVADKSLTLEGPEITDFGLAYDLYPLYTEDSQFGGKHAVTLADHDRGLRIELILASDEKGTLTVDSHTVSTFERTLSEEEIGYQDFVRLYGDLSVEGADLTDYDTGSWTIRSAHRETGKTYGSVMLLIGEETYDLCVSDTVTLEEFCADARTWSESERTIAIAGTEGWYFACESDCYAVWSKNGRVYRLSGKESGEETLTALAETICG